MQRWDVLSQSIGYHFIGLFLKGREVVQSVLKVKDKFVPIVNGLFPCVFSCEKIVFAYVFEEFLVCELQRHRALGSFCCDPTTGHFILLHTLLPSYCKLSYPLTSLPSQLPIRTQTPLHASLNPTLYLYPLTRL